MTEPLRPRLRRLDSFPVNQAGGEVAFALRDPEGFSGSIVIPYGAAVLASLMDGTRTVEEILDAFRQQFGQAATTADIERLIQQFDERCLLDNDRFRAIWKVEVERYLNLKTRPAAHAGGAYAAEPVALRAQMAGLFTSEKGPGEPDWDAGDVPVTGELCGVLSPHIDLHRGGPAFAWAYKRIVEQSQADLFVILGTAHSPMRSLFSATKKNFDTPLGTVETDRQFVATLSANLARTPGGKEMNLFADELAHRQEHSIEFQTVFLQYLLGDRRPFKIVPILTGSFHDFVRSGTSPQNAPEVAAFVSALQQTTAKHPSKVCYISAGDLAHIGQRFGDREFLDAARLKNQAESDRSLLDAVCQADAEGLFRQIANEKDRHRICGLSPTYTMLEAMRPDRGELLRYDQAVELDGTSCVSFASAAFYRQPT